MSDPSVTARAKRRRWITQTIFVWLMVLVGETPTSSAEGFHGRKLSKSSKQKLVFANRSSLRGAKGTDSVGVFTKGTAYDAGEYEQSSLDWVSISGRGQKGLNESGTYTTKGKWSKSSKSASQRTIKKGNTTKTIHATRAKRAQRPHWYCLRMANGHTIGEREVFLPLVPCRADNDP
jgi:hypothetical protein